MPNTQIQKKTETLRTLLNSNAIKEQIARVLPKHCTPDRFLRIATTALLKTPKLAECSQESFIQAMLDCSSLGIEPDGRLAHLIPYGDTCTLIVDWKGLVALAKRSGEIRTWKPETVNEADIFTWKNGEIAHEIDWRSPRGALQAVYSHVITKDGEHDYEVMAIDEVDKIRARSRAANDGPWVTDYEEMAKKTVIRRHSKRLTLSAEFHDATLKDFDTRDAIDIETVPATPAPASLVDSGAPASKPEKAKRNTAAKKAKGVDPDKMASTPADDEDLLSLEDDKPKARDLDAEFGELLDTTGFSETDAIQGAHEANKQIEIKAWSDMIPSEKMTVLEAHGIVAP